MFSEINIGKENIIVNGLLLYKSVPRLDKHGYYKYSMNTGKSEFAHRLVAKTYIPNPNNYPIVNHIDCNPKNNHYTNLEWCTYKWNSDWKFINGYEAKTKKTLVYKNNVFIKEFSTTRKAILYICSLENTTERNVARRMQYKDYKIIVPENGDTLEYSVTAKHHFTTKEQKKYCYLYQNYNLIAEFNCKNDALKFCKDNYKSSESIRRYNHQTKNNLYLVYNKNDIKTFIDFCNNEISNKGKTSKKNGYLYIDGIFIGEFKSINQASLFCKIIFEAKLSLQKPYRNINKGLLFWEHELFDNEFNIIWDDIIKHSQYKPKTVW